MTSPRPRRSDPSPVATALVLTGLLAIGCGEPEAPSDTTREPRPTTAVAVVPLDIRGVNELLVGGTTLHTALFYYGLFLPLAEEQADYHDGPPSFEPRLAASWEFSEDRLRLTFRLREAEWSDGTPITADDVVWTHEAQTHPDVGWTWADSKNRITGVEAVDPRTVVYTFSEAYATQLLDAATGVVLPRHVWSRVPFEEWREKGDWFLENLVVSGPYDLETWEPDQRIVLVANPRYFDPTKPGLERLVLRIVPDRTAQLGLLRSGEAQFVEWIRPGDAATVEAAPELELVPYLPRWYTFVMWNTRRAALSDARVRTALTHGIDRRTILDTLYFGRGTVDASPYPSDLWVNHPDLEPLAFDPERSRSLLDEAGWIDSDGDGVRERDGESLRLEIVTNSDNELRRDVLVMLQEQLKAVGVDVEPVTLEFAAVFERAASSDFDGFFTTLSVDTTLDMSYVFSTAAIADGYNWAGWSNVGADRALEAARTAVDPVAALPDYHALQEILHREQPMTLLWEQEQLIGKHRDLVGVAPNALSVFFDLEEWRFAE